MSRPRAGGGRDARHAAHRGGGAGRRRTRPAAIEFRREPFARLCGICMGHGYLSRAATRAGAAASRKRQPARRHQARSHAGVLAHGRNFARRPAEQGHAGARPAHARGLDGRAAAAKHRGRRRSADHRGRREAGPHHARPAPARGDGRHFCRARSRRREVLEQLDERLPHHGHAGNHGAQSRHEHRSGRTRQHRHQEARRQARAHQRRGARGVWRSADAR